MSEIRRTLPARNRYNYKRGGLGMIEQTISVQKMLTYVAWVWVVVLLLSAATVGLASGRWWIALLLAEASCVASAIAATLTVRCYMSKLAALVRATAAESREPARLHTLR